MCFAALSGRPAFSSRSAVLATRHLVDNRDAKEGSEDSELGLGVAQRRAALERSGGSVRPEVDARDDTAVQVDDRPIRRLTFGAKHECPVKNQFATSIERRP